MQYNEPITEYRCGRYGSVAKRLHQLSSCFHHHHQEHLVSLYSQLRERELDAEWRADGVGPFNTRGSWQPLLTQEKFKK